MNLDLFTNSLTQFHIKFTSVLDELPQNGRALEITKRIMIIVVSPFAYLTLGCLSLVGRFYNSVCWDKKIIKPVIDLSGKMNEVRQSLLTEMIEAKAINEMQSAKIFFNVSLNEEKLNKDYIIKQIDNSDFNNEFLSQKIDSIMIELKEKIQIENCTEFKVQWNALIKDRNVTFTRVHGSIREGSSKGVSSGNWKDIPLNGAERVFKFVLEQMGRDITPQLNDQLEFV